MVVIKRGRVPARAADDAQLTQLRAPSPSIRRPHCLPQRQGRGKAVTAGLARSESLCGEPLRKACHDGLAGDKASDERDSQTSGTVLMVRPASFGFHAEAAAVERLRQCRGADPARRAAASSTAWSRRWTARASRCWSSKTAPDPGQARRDLPQQLGVVPRRRDDGPLSDGDRGPAAGARVDGAQGAAGGSAASRCGGWSTSASTSGTATSSKARGAWCSIGPRRRAFANLSPRTDAARDRRFRRAARLFDLRVRRARPLGPADLSHQCAAQPRHPLRNPVHRSGRARISRDPDRRDRGQRPDADRGRLRPDAAIRLQLHRAERPRRSPVIALSSAARRSFRPDQLRAARKLRRDCRGGHPDDRSGRRRQRPLHDRRHSPAARSSRAL